MAKKLLPDIDRFFQSIVIKDQSHCWEWQKARDKDGYGLFKIYPRMWRAHRWIYEQVKSKIPEGLQIDHLCCNNWCVNPDHLQTVTPLENTRLGWKRGTHVAHFTPHTEATKEKIRNKAIGRKASVEARMKMSLARIGNKYCLGYKQSLGTKNKHRRNAEKRCRKSTGQFI